MYFFDASFSANCLESLNWRSAALKMSEMFFSPYATLTLALLWPDLWPRGLDLTTSSSAMLQESVLSTIELPLLPFCSLETAEVEDRLSVIFEEGEGGRGAGSMGIFSVVLL